MSIPARIAPRLRPLSSSMTKNARYFASTTTVEEWPQRTPLGSYYETILHKPTPYRTLESSINSIDHATPSYEQRSPIPSSGDSSKTTTSKSSPNHPPPAETRPAPGEQTPEERMRNIFGSRVLSPEEIAQRLATKQSQSTYISGILVPPQPEEPDNCCMSGCVNCVWDRYREDMEEWTYQKARAQEALAAQSAPIRSHGIKPDLDRSKDAIAKVGDTKIAKDLWADDVFDNVPVGIREFMKQEKRLKERHAKENAERA
ncbi:oxidoreductase-like protein [Mariannaea sp. PMI_226]|nr:oxidoreductase-like protein [Mariannaea sp. PMI_226]